MELEETEANCLRQYVISSEVKRHSRTSLLRIQRGQTLRRKADIYQVPPAFEALQIHYLFSNSDNNLVKSELLSSSFSEEDRKP
jgi:hypothetical protein